MLNPAMKGTAAREGCGDTSPIDFGRDQGATVVDMRYVATHCDDFHDF
jgi:hypothetical protein